MFLLQKTRPNSHRKCTINSQNPGVLCLPPTQVIQYFRKVEYGYRKVVSGISLAVPWFRFRAFTAGGTGLILGWRTKILRGMRQGQKTPQNWFQMIITSAHSPPSNKSSIQTRDYEQIQIYFNAMSFSMCLKTS